MKEWRIYREFSNGSKFYEYRPVGILTKRKKKQGVGGRGEGRKSMEGPANSFCRGPRKAASQTVKRDLVTE